MQLQTMRSGAKTKPYPMLKFLFFPILALTFGLWTSHTSHAQTPPTVPIIYAPSIIIAPQNAPQNTLREITVQGQWPNGCTPTGGVMATELAETDYLITIGLLIPQTLVACTQVITSYSFKFSYTPKALGVIRVAVKADATQPGNSANISTSLAGQNRGIADVSGMWYDPTTNGSGMSIIHNFQGITSAVFGAWFAYDNAGNPRWLTIQEGKWETNAVLVGNLYETKSASNQCAASAPLCINRFSSIEKIGTARFSFTGIGPNSGTPPQAVFEGFNTNGAAMIKSSAVRLPL